METLVIENKDKDEVVTAINKHRRNNSNRWYQVRVELNNFTYKIKAYGTWVQILRKEDKGNVVWNTSSPMELKVKDFITFLESNLI